MSSPSLFLVILKVFNWNIIGINNSDWHKIVRNWLRKNKPKIGVLLETRIRKENAASVIQAACLGWSFDNNSEGVVFRLIDCLGSQNFSHHLKNNSEVYCL